MIEIEVVHLSSSAQPHMQVDSAVPRGERGAERQIGSLQTVNRDSAAERLMYSLGSLKAVNKFGVWVTK